MRLLESGVDVTVIALWLGHEQVSTTNIYLVSRRHDPKGTSHRARHITGHQTRPLPGPRHGPDLPRHPVIMPT